MKDDIKKLLERNDYCVDVRGTKNDIVMCLPDRIYPPQTLFNTASYHYYKDKIKIVYSKDGMELSCKEIKAPPYAHRIIIIHNIIQLCVSIQYSIFLVRFFGDENTEVDSEQFFQLHPSPFLKTKDLSREVAMDVLITEYAHKSITGEQLEELAETEDLVDGMNAFFEYERFVTGSDD